MKIALVPIMLHALLCALSAQAQAAGPKFTLRCGDQSLVFDRDELLARPDATVLTIDYDPAFPRQTMKYHAVPLAPLFKGLKIPPGATLKFECLDGFSAPISVTRVLNESKKASIAYLAIEAPGEKWPEAGHHDGRTAAPFYLVWKDPKKSRIGQEEWPYELAGFAVTESVASQYPAILPDVHLKAGDPVNRGLRVFLKNCFSCHTINGQGAAQMGPDLNAPMGPTEYYVPAALKLLIRDPQSVRRWPQAKMNGFDAKAISDSELSDLIAYLHHMAGRKRHLR